MTQQSVDLALNIRDLLYDNWELEDHLEKTKFKWFSYEPTRIEVRELPMSISIVYQSGTGTPISKAVSQMADVLKIDIWMAIKNGENEKVRIISEANRMLVKDQIFKIIHDNQTGITGVKFGKYIRGIRNDETENGDKQWFLHEILFIQASWYHTES
jgi:hypothetical protein